MKSKPRFFARFASFILFSMLGVFAAPSSQAETSEDEFVEAQDDFPAAETKAKDRRNKNKAATKENENKELSNADEQPQFKHNPRLRSGRNTAPVRGKGKRYPDLEVDPD